MLAASWPEESVAELAGCSAKVRLTYLQQRTPAMQEEAAIDIGALNRRVADLEIESASRKRAAFVVIKLHAVIVASSASVLVLRAASVISVGTIAADQFDKDMLIDTRCGMVAAKAMKLKTGDLIVQQKAQDE